MSQGLSKLSVIARLLHPRSLPARAHNSSLFQPTRQLPKAMNTTFRHRQHPFPSYALHTRASTILMDTTSHLRALTRTEHGQSPFQCQMVEAATAQKHRMPGGRRMPHQFYQRLLCQDAVLAVAHCRGVTLEPNSAKQQLRLRRHLHTRWVGFQCRWTVNLVGCQPQYCRVTHKDGSPKDARKDSTPNNGARPP
jgi:hypothetical protein